ncbi:MAG: four helix bundle protein [Gemmatimonadaceae bacterium]
MLTVHGTRMAERLLWHGSDSPPGDGTAQSPSVSDYRKLQVWRKAHALAINAHRTATRIRGAHLASFRSQIIRSAMSVPTNIVEGREQGTEVGFTRFLRIALGSLSELEYHLVAARDLGAISRSDHLSLSSQLTEVRKMLHGLVRALEHPASRPG